VADRLSRSSTALCVRIVNTLFSPSAPLDSVPSKGTLPSPV
jgi:hypothetical protein